MNSQSDAIANEAAVATPATRRWLWVPNLITILRFVLTAAFPFASPTWRATLIFAAAFSDFADGYLARRFNLTSWVGGILDAIADKAFILTALITFAAEDRIEWWQLGLLLARDVCVAFVAIYVSINREWSAFKHMASRRLGKLTTACLFPFLIALALTSEESVPMILLFAVCAALSVLAGADYLIKFARAVRRPRAATT
ncbi:MAG: CDP-alcohol phosphatidyltransferase family protein [Phycisphaeraceae bacterium]